MLVAQWGNSLAVRLPAALVSEIGLSAGDEIELKPKAQKTTGYTAEVSKSLGKEDLFEVLDKYSRAWPKGFKFDREEANQR